MLALVGASDGALLLSVDAVGEAVPSTSSWARFTADRVDLEAEPVGAGVDAAPAALAGLRVLLADAGVSDLALVSLATEASRGRAGSSVLAAEPLEGRFLGSPFGVSDWSAVRRPDVFTGRLGNRGATAPGISRGLALEAISSGPAPSREPGGWWSGRVESGGEKAGEDEWLARFLVLDAPGRTGLVLVVVVVLLLLG